MACPPEIARMRSHPLFIPPCWSSLWRKSSPLRFDLQTRPPLARGLLNKGFDASHVLPSPSPLLHMTAVFPRLRPLVLPLLLLSLWLVPAALVEAHHLPPELEEIDEFAGEAFKAGWRHPGQGLDHWLLAAVAGVLAGSAARRRDAMLTAMTFLGGMAAGGLLPTMSVASSGDWFSPAMAGLLLIAGGRLPRALSLSLLALAAGWQGQAHLAVWPWDTVAHPYLGGMLLSSAGLVGLSAAVTRLADLQRARQHAPAAG